MTGAMIGANPSTLLTWKIRRKQVACCSKKVEQFRAGVRTGPLNDMTRTSGPQVLAATYDRVVFEYVGNTAMTVVGPATGKRYRFDRQGARLEEHLRDRRALAAAPHLRQTLPR